MDKPLRILNLEDNFSDAELVKFELEEAGFTLIAKVVNEKYDFIQALHEFKPDIILSDYDLPQYNGALALADAKKICPDTPFILVTGAVSEERAIEILTNGAKDYVMKHRISRLVPAVQRVLAEVKEHHARLNAEIALKKSEKQAREQLEEIQTFYDFAPIGLCFLDKNLRYVRINRHMAKMNGRPAAEHIGRTVREIIPEMAPFTEIIANQILQTGEPILDYEIKSVEHFQSGNEYNWLTNWMPLKDNRDNVIGINVTVEDITKIKKAEEILRNAHDNLEIQIRKHTASLEAEIAERKLAETVLKQSEMRERQRAEELQTIFDTVPIGLAIAEDIHGIHIRGNRTNEEIYGLPSGAELSKSGPQAAGFRVYQESRELPFNELPMQRAIRGEAVKEHVLEVHREDGQTLSVFAKAMPLFDEAGHPRGAVGAFLDITAMKRAQDALRASENLERERVGELATILDAIPTPVIIAHDPECAHMTGNRAANELLGLQGEEEISLTASSERKTNHYKAFKYGRELRLDEMPIRRAAKGENVQGFEYTLAFEDGTVRELMASATPLKDDNGNLRGAVHTLVDITDYKQALQAQERLSALINHTPSLVFLKDESGRYVYVNNAYIEQFNLPQDWLGKTDFDFWPAKSAELFRAHDAEVLRTGQTRQFLEDTTDLAGNRHCWLCYKFLFTDSESQPYVGGIGIDVVDRVRAEEALTRFVALSESTPIGAGISSMDGVLQYTNPAFENIVGYGPGEMVGRKASDIWWNAEDSNAWLNIVNKDGIVRDFQAKLRKKDGTAVWGSMGGSPIVFGNESGIMCTIQDITKSREAEENLNLYATKLKEANEELESFSYSVSHDLRAPLRAIDGYSRMILKRKGNEFDEETRRQFNQVRKSAKTMGQLIDDLLSLSKSGRQDLVMKSLNIRRIIKKAWDGLQNDNPNRNMTLKINQSLPSGLGDEGLIQQVFANFLANAVKFTKTRDKALIEAGGYERGQESIFYVKDNGVGFDMQYHDKLFGAFQRLHSANEYEGTGIGMALVKRIIHRHDGQVWAEGEVDKGATFYFTLPLQHRNE